MTTPPSDRVASAGSRAIAAAFADAQNDAVIGDAGGALGALNRVYLNIGLFSEVAGYVYDSPFHTGPAWTGMLNVYGSGLATPRLAVATHSTSSQSLSRSRSGYPPKLRSAIGEPK